MRAVVPTVEVVELLEGAMKVMDSVCIIALLVIMDPNATWLADTVPVAHAVETLDFVLTNVPLVTGALCVRTNVMETARVVG